MNRGSRTCRAQSSMRDARRVRGFAPDTAAPPASGSRAHFEARIAVGASAQPPGILPKKTSGSGGCAAHHLHDALRLIGRLAVEVRDRRARRHTGRRRRRRALGVTDAPAANSASRIAIEDTTAESTSACRRPSIGCDSVTMPPPSGYAPRTAHGGDGKALFKRTRRRARRCRSRQARDRRRLVVVGPDGHFQRRVPRTNRRFRRRSRKNADDSSVAPSLAMVRASAAANPARASQLSRREARRKRRNAGRHLRVRRQNGLGGIAALGRRRPRPPSTASPTIGAVARATTADGARLGQRGPRAPENPKKTREKGKNSDAPASCDSRRAFRAARVAPALMYPTPRRTASAAHASTSPRSRRLR